MVVIPVLNAARTLLILFDALDRLAPAPLEILFVDNGSTDNGPTLMRSFAERTERGVKTLVEPKRSASAACNTGIRPAKGEVVAFTDSDCGPDPRWFFGLAS